jgi:phage gpG-like protein
MDALGLLNKNEKKDKKDKKGKQLKPKEILYKEKLKEITEALIKLVGNNIEFAAIHTSSSIRTCPAIPSRLFVFES